MRITFQIEGGIAYFPGLARPSIIVVDTLPKTQGEKLRQLIDGVHFFDLPARVGGASALAADRMTYTIKVVDGKRRHVVQASDPLPAGLAPLITGLQDALRTQRSNPSSPSRQ